MPRWMKMGCGHLVALPLLAIGTAFTASIGRDLYSGDTPTVIAFLITAGFLGVGGGLMLYLWARVWTQGKERESQSKEREPKSGEAGFIQRWRTHLYTYLREYPDRAAGEAEMTASLRAGVTIPNEDVPELSRWGEKGRVEEKRPWEAREEWAKGRIRAERGTVWEGKRWYERNSLPMSTFGGTLLVGVGSYVLIASNAGPWKIALAGGFILPGLLIFGYVAYRLWCRFRFGTTTFGMETLPGELGGRLCGTIHTGLSPDQKPEEGLRVKLSCYRRFRMREAGEISVGNRTVIHRQLIWRDEKQIECQPSSDGGGLDVPVAFDVPEDLPASTPEPAENRIMWVLRVTGALPGVDYSAAIEVPVFPVEPDESVPVHRYTRHEKDISSAAALPVSDGISLDRASTGALDVTVAGGRFPFRASLASVVASGLGIVTLPILLIGLTLFFVALPLLPGVLLLLGTFLVGVYACYLWTYSSRIQVDNEGIAVRDGLSGFERTTRLPNGKLEDVRLGGRYYPPWDTYDLFLVRDVSPQEDSTERKEDEGPSQGTGETEEVVAAQMLPNHREAEWIATQIKEAADWNAVSADR